MSKAARNECFSEVMNRVRPLLSKGLEKCKYIFSVDTKSSNRVIIYVLGFRVRFLKSGIKEASQKYVKLECSVTEIPKATGTLRKIQMANLKMILLFDNLCKENGLEYWLDFGNLLGAVRHKGFIPWDDDVDVSMSRDDYEKFIELYKNGFPEYDDLYIEFNNNGKNKCFIKILHKKLVNIGIDIFPYDFYYKKINIEEKLEITKLIKKIISRRLYRLLCPFYKNSADMMRKRFIKLRDNEILKNNSVDKSIEPALFYGIDFPHSYGNYFFDYDKIFPLKKISYEGFELPCPNNPEFILEQVFGDYMSIPDDCYPRHTNSEAFDEKLLDEFIGDYNEEQKIIDGSGTDRN